MPLLENKGTGKWPHIFKRADNNNKKQFTSQIVVRRSSIKPN